jgi:hypothetical protein
MLAKQLLPVLFSRICVVRAIIEWGRHSGKIMIPGVGIKSEFEKLVLEFQSWLES